MSGETEEQVSGWTTDTVLALFGQLREADHRFQEERDRRYAEVAVEREKALRIKETADLAALQLAREIQTYKDEKANELRSQIESERGQYVTRNDLTAVTEKMEAQLVPITDYVRRDQGRSQGVDNTTKFLLAVVTVIGGLVGIAGAIALFTR